MWCASELPYSKLFDHNRKKHMELRGKSLDIRNIRGKNLNKPKHNTGGELKHTSKSRRMSQRIPRRW
jgi:hypothetical protein